MSVARENRTPPVFEQGHDHRRYLEQSWLVVAEEGIDCQVLRLLRHALGLEILRLGQLVEALAGHIR